jgi:hypothetical protein
VLTVCSGGLLLYICSLAHPVKASKQIAIPNAILFFILAPPQCSRLSTGRRVDGMNSQMITMIKFTGQKIFNNDQLDT